MSDSNPTAEASEAASDEVVSREPNEAYTLDVWTNSGLATTESSYHTYDRTEGLYKLSPNDNPEVVDLLDGVIAALEDKYGAVDEAGFSRIEGDAYEILITVVDADDVSAYDSTFEHNDATVHVTTENDPEAVEDVDEALDILRDAVSA